MPTATPPSEPSPDRTLIFGEEGGSDEESDAKAVVEFIIGKQTFAVAIVPVKIKILV